MRVWGWNRRRALGALAATAALLLGAASLSVQALAATGADAADDGDLIVESGTHVRQLFDLSPGESRYWTVEASLLGADRGSLALRVFGAGSLVEHPRHGLLVAVDGCDGALEGVGPRVKPACVGADFVPIIVEQPLAAISSDPTADESDDVWALPDIVRGERRSFVVTLALPVGGADDKSLMGLRGQIGVGLYAAGDAAQPPSEPGEPLPATGASSPWALLLLGGGAVGLGLVLARVRRPRTQP